MFVLLLVVHLQSARFGRALLWHRCCKKKKRNREVKLYRQNFSLNFLVFHCICPGFKTEFSLEGNLTGFPKVSNKYPRPKKL